MPDAGEHLINLMVQLRRTAPLSGLTGDEERLLFELYVMAQAHSQILVTDVYQCPGFGSRSSSYRTLVSLREKDIVAFDVDETDRRKRRVTFTDAAQIIFSSLS